ncbi:MAG: site-2 protease family protein [Firmicutes bacterium]|nr:site-2 protease family protein [Bacillota bacterium]
MAFDKKKKKKIKFRFLPFLVVLTLILYSFLGFSQVSQWLGFNDVRSSLTFLDYLLWFFLTFYISLTIHELGHFFSFVFQQVKLRALYITIFIFHKTEKGWRFRIKPKLIVLLGGLVVPDFGDVKDENEYQKIVKKFSRALIAAPIVTITFLSVTIVSFILAVLFVPQSEFMGIIYLLAFYAIPINLLFIYSFTLSNPMFFGDFVAYKKMRTDQTFALAMITQYSMFTLSDSKESDHFIWEKSRDTLKGLPISSSQFHTMILLSYIDGVIRRDEPLDHTIDIKINRIPIRKYLKDELGLSLIYDIASYHYFNSNVEKAYKLFDDIQKLVSTKLDSKMLNYNKMKYMHILHLEYQDSFLSNKDNYFIGNNWIFDVLVDPYELLQAHHEKLPFREYSTVVHLEEVEPVIEEEQKSDSD